MGPAGTHEEVQELRVQLEEEAEISAQAYERVQTAEAELAQLRSEYTALQVSTLPVLVPADRVSCLQVLQLAHPQHHIANMCTRMHGLE